MPTIRVPLAYNIHERLIDHQDSFLFNMFAEEGEDGVARAVKRPGLAPWAILESPGIGRGLFSWQGSIVSAVGSNMYRIRITPEQQFDSFIAGAGVPFQSLGNNNPQAGETEQVLQEQMQSLSPGTDPLSFAETDEPSLFILDSDNDQGFLLDENFNSVEITDNDFPDNLVLGVEWMDGFIFVMDHNGQIFNSDFEDYDSWNPLNAITAEFEADTGVALSQHLNYLVAHGRRSTEFFVNAGLSAPGSPLQRADNTYLPIGCAAGATVVNIATQLIWVAEDRFGNFSVINMTNLEPRTVSTSSVQRILEQNRRVIRDARAYAFRSRGHVFYVLTLADRTLVYDMTTQQWYEWGTGLFRFIASVGSVFHDGRILTQNRDEGHIYEIRSTRFTDVDNNIICKIKTPLVDFGSQQQDTRNKFLHRLDIVGDYSRLEQDPNIVRIRWSDDDSQTFSNWRELEVKDRARLTRLGRFNRRTFELEHTEDEPLRLEALELRYSLGSH